jgi:histidinol dehydrogenase
MTCKMILNSADTDFSDRFAALQSMKREQDADVHADVSAIIEAVRADGDDALYAYTKKFDRLDLKQTDMQVSDAEIDAAEAACALETRAALENAAARIADYHARQKPEDNRFTDAVGVELGHRWTPVDAAGLYVPGGLANYPSSVLMNAIPARVAGVPRVAMVVPAPEGAINPLVLAAAKYAGVNEIFRIGGAQAIAALAYGTATVAPVDVIVGPGNAYVAAAKKQVFGQVGIDMMAGPSEILVVADADNDPAWIAADLMSQAEHDDVAQSVLICDSTEFADAVIPAVDALLNDLPRADIARRSWENFGAVIIVENVMTQAADLVNALAPEHLELAVEDPEALARDIRHAGAIFLGRYTPEAVGDYIAGPNHVLPTARASRYASGLSVLDFMKRSSLVRCDAASLAEIGPDAMRLADEEGLHAHGRSISIRLNQRPAGSGKNG